MAVRSFWDGVLLWPGIIIRNSRYKELQMNNVDVYDIAEIKERLVPIFKDNRVKRAVLFGSYAKGEAGPRSDIDILVDSGLRGLDFVGLIEFVREALQKNVDVFDVCYVKKGSRVEREIAETGVPIYGE
jgi:predicted nucleotidyltransferase